MESIQSEAQLETVQSERSGLLLVAIAVLLFSTSPVLIIWAAPLTPFEITFGRMLVAGLAVLGLALWLRESPLQSLWRDRRRFAVYGLITALHFFFYIASLSYTLISHSLALVYTSPIFIAILSAIFLHEPLSRRKYPGVVLAVVGVAIMAGFEPKLNGQILFGDFLALLSAICFALYSVIGRAQRTRYRLFTYAGSVYSAAALWMLPAALVGWWVRVSGQIGPVEPLNEWRVFLSILALGLGPLATGHTLYNAGLRRAGATAVNLIATQEVTGGVLLGAILLGQIPSPAAIIGGLITLIGILVVVR